MPNDRADRTVRLPLLAAAAVILGAQALLSGAMAQATPPPQTAPSPQPAPPRPPAVDYWQPEWMVRELWGPGRMPKGMQVRMLRHLTYMQTGVPKEYAGAASTVAPGAETLAAGGQLYGKHCASCHGKDGLGDGDAGNALSPSPALLAFMITRPVSVDEYLLWSIAEGGKPFDTAMPAFKDQLARDDIWRIVAYMRAGFGEERKGR